MKRRSRRKDLLSLLHSTRRVSSRSRQRRRIYGPFFFRCITQARHQATPTDVPTLVRGLVSPRKKTMDESSRLLVEEEGNNSTQKKRSHDDASRDMLVASWLFLLGSFIFTLCVANELFVDFRSLPFWMLTTSGLLFCAGSIEFIRAFGGEQEASRVIFEAAHADDEVETAGCSACVSRHFATDLLVASWLFLAACVPVVVASACYVIHHDYRVYFWGVLAGSLAFTVASAFFVVASYPPAAHRLRTQQYFILHEEESTHCGSEWLVSNWLFLLLTGGWLLSSAYLLLLQPNSYDFRFSFIEATIYFLASIYFVKGSYKAQNQAARRRRFSQNQREDYDDGALGRKKAPTGAAPASSQRYDHRDNDELVCAPSRNPFCSASEQPSQGGQRLQPRDGIFAHGGGR